MVQEDETPPKAPEPKPARPSYVDVVAGWSNDRHPMKHVKDSFVMLLVTWWILTIAALAFVVGINGFHIPYLLKLAAVSGVALLGLTPFAGYLFWCAHRERGAS